MTPIPRHDVQSHTLSTNDLHTVSKTSEMTPKPLPEKKHILDNFLVHVYMINMVISIRAREPSGHTSQETRYLNEDLLESYGKVPYRADENS